MSFRKKQLIQERNLLIERKYLLEQEKTSGTIEASGTTGNTMTTGSTAPASPQVVTTTTKKMTKTEIDKLPNCSSFNQKDYQIQPGNKEGNVTIYTLNGKNFCKKEK